MNFNQSRGFDNFLKDYRTPNFNDSYIDNLATQVYSPIDLGVNTFDVMQTLSPNTFDFGSQGRDNFNWMNNVLDSGGEYDSSWYTDNFGGDDLKNTNFFDTEVYPDLTLEEAGMLEDITSISNPEKNVLDDYGLIQYNDDGSVSQFDSNQAIATLSEVANDPNLSNFEKQSIVDTANQLASAADAGLDYFEFAPGVGEGTVLTEDYVNASNLPIGAEPYMSIEGEKYIDPFSPNFIQASNMVAGPDGKVPFFGNQIATAMNQFGAEDRYSRMSEDGYMFPEQTQTPAQAMNYVSPNPFRPVTAGDIQRASFAGKLAADKYGHNSYGEPNQMIPGQRYEPQQTFASRVDSFTDGIRDFGGMLLKPVNFVTDTIGGGIQKVGQMIGDNKVGRGLLNFGGIVDNTGDYLFGDSDRGSLLGTVMNVPDSIANMGQGLAYGNWDMAKAGAMGLLGAPLSIVGNLASPFVSGLVDVAGIDQIKIGAGGGGGGGGKNKKKPSGKARPNVPIVSNKGGMTKGNGNLAATSKPGQGSTFTDDDGSDYDFSNQDDRNMFAEKYGDGALAQRMADLGVGTVGSVNMGSEKPFKSTDADRSQVAEGISANQGNPGGVKKAPEVDVLDMIAGPGSEVEAEDSNSTSFIDRPSDLFTPSEAVDFAYEEGDEAFA